GAGVPGTPTEKPLLTASAKGNGCPVAGSTKAVGRIAAGAVSRPSRVTTRCVAAWKYTKKPPPPIPAEYGSVTPRVAAAATAASTALPPARSTSIADRLASASTVATAPPVPIATACLPGGGGFDFAAANGALPASNAARTKAS